MCIHTVSHMINKSHDVLKTSKTISDFYWLQLKTTLHQYQFSGQGETAQPVKTILFLRKDLIMSLGCHQGWLSETSSTTETLQNYKCGDQKTCYSTRQRQANKKMLLVALWEMYDTGLFALDTSQGLKLFCFNFDSPFNPCLVIPITTVVKYDTKSLDWNQSVIRSLLLNFHYWHHLTWLVLWSTDGEEII